MTKVYALLQSIEAESGGEGRICTCHPNDNPPRPCPRRYALSECRKAAESGERVPSRPCAYPGRLRNRYD